MTQNGIRYVTTGGGKTREVARQFKADEDIQVRLRASAGADQVLTPHILSNVFPIGLPASL